MPMTPTQRMHDLLRRYTSFLTALETQLAYDVTPIELPPATDEDLAAAESAAGLSVPEDLRVFWSAGARDVAIVVQLGRIPICRDAFLTPIDAGDLAPRSRVRGIPFRGGEHFCYVDADGAVRTRGDAQEAIAGSFADWFELWLASGCWSAGADPSLFAMHWSLVAPLVPVRRLPENNAWLAHLARVDGHRDFPGRYGRSTNAAVWARP